MSETVHPRSASSSLPFLAFRNICIYLFSSFLAISLSAVTHAQELPDSPEVTGSISGSVVDLQNEALSGIEVSAYRSELDHYGDQFWSRHKSVVTDEMGNFQIGLLITGIYRIGVSDPAADYLPQYYEQSKTLDDATDVPIAGNNVEGLEFRLARGGSIAGTVTDSAGIGLSNIAVDAYVRTPHRWALTQETTTDGSGYFRIHTLDSGSYVLGFAAEYSYGVDPRFVAEYFDEAPSLAAAAELEILTGTVISDLNVELARFGSITGTIEVSSVMDSDVTISLYSSEDNFQRSVRRKFFYADGGELINYAFRNLKPGLYQAAARATVGFYYLDVPLLYFEYYGDSPQSESALTIEVKDDQNTPNINFFLDTAEAPVNLQGVVRNSNGDPVADIEVVADIEITDCLPWEDPYDCEIYPREVARVTTDEDGRYLLSGLEPSDYTVRFVDPNRAGGTAVIPKPIHYLEWLTARRLDPGDNFLDVSLELAGAIGGIASTWDERAPDEVKVTLYRYRDSFWAPIDSWNRYNYHDPYAPVPSPHPAENGFRFNFYGLKPGLYRMNASGDHGGDPFDLYYNDALNFEHAATITVTEGMITEGINFTVGEDRANASMGGTVTISGVPQEGVQVDLYRRDTNALDKWPHLVYTFTDAQGRYAIDGLRAGEYRLRFSNPDTNSLAIYYENASSPEEAQTIILRSDSDSFDASVDLPGFSGAQINDRHHLYAPVLFR